MQAITQELHQMPVFISNDSIKIICSYVDDLNQAYDAMNEEIDSRKYHFMKYAKLSFNSIERALKIIKRGDYIYTDVEDLEASEYIETGEYIDTTDDFEYCQFSAFLCRMNADLMIYYISYKKFKYFYKIWDDIKEIDDFEDYKNYNEMVKIEADDDLITTLSDIFTFKDKTLDIINNWQFIKPITLSWGKNIYDIFPDLNKDI